MRKTNINYPHPVLSVANDDYINCSFNIALKDNPFVEGDFAVIDIIYDLECDGLKQLIENGEAIVVIYLESVEAEYRKTFAFDSICCTKTIKENKKHA